MNFITLHIPSPAVFNWVTSQLVSQGGRATTGTTRMISIHIGRYPHQLKQSWLILDSLSVQSEHRVRGSASPPMGTLAGGRR